MRVAISGRKKTGKNTLAEMIGESSPNPYIVVAVADPIKRMVLEMVPDAVHECLFGESELRERPLPGNLRNADDEPLTYRRLIEDLGALGRRYNPDVWLDALIKHRERERDVKTYIVSDCRFPNELNYLKKEGFYMVRIRRKEAPVVNTPSETAQMEVPDEFFHQVIDNDYTVDYLREAAKEIYRRHRQGKIITRY